MGGNASRYTPPFSDEIMRTVAIVPKVTSIPSIIGSIFVIQDVLRSNDNKKQKKTVYHRIMLGMSAMDLLWAIRCFLSTWIVPKDFHPVIPYASGTDGSCTFVGFLGHASAVTSVLYSAVLTLYFLLVVRFGLPEDRIKRYYEKWFHIFPNLIGWGVGIASIPLGLYKPIPWTCFITAVPYACPKAVKFANVSPETCEAPDINTGAYRWGFFFAWIWASFIFMFVAMAMMYTRLLSTERKSRKYSFASKSGLSVISSHRPRGESSAHRSNGSFATSMHRKVRTMKDGTKERRSTNSQDNRSVEFTDVLEVQEPRKQVISLQPSMDNDDEAAEATDRLVPESRTRMDFNHESIESLDMPADEEMQNVVDFTTAALSSSSPVALKTRSLSIESYESGFRSMDSDDVDVAAATTHSSRIKRTRPTSGYSSSQSISSTISGAPRTTKPKKNSRKFVNQAALYVSFFIITWIFNTIQGSINAFVGTGYSYLLVLITIVTPLQGFFNALIYVRPRYLRYRKEHPEEASLCKFLGSICERASCRSWSRPRQ